MSDSDTKPNIDEGTLKLPIQNNNAIKQKSGTSNLNNRFTQLKTARKSASQQNDDTVSQQNDDTASQQNDDTASQQNDDTVSQQNDDTVSRQNDDTVSQQNDDTVSQQNDDTVSQQNDDDTTPQHALTDSEVPSVKGSGYKKTGNVFKFSSSGKYKTNVFTHKRPHKSVKNNNSVTGRGEPNSMKPRLFVVISALVVVALVVVLVLILTNHINVMKYKMSKEIVTGVLALSLVFAVPLFGISLLTLESPQQQLQLQSQVSPTME